MTWHLDPTAVQHYRSGELTANQCASIDTHIVACADCRAVVAAATATVDAASLARVKKRIDTRLDTVTPSLPERVLGAIGVAPVAARVMAVSLSLSASWLAAGVAALTFAAIAASNGSDRAFALFLVVAPLVPMAGVAVAFGPGLDPAQQITVAAPMPMSRIILLRTIAVVGAALPVLLLLSVALPGWSLTSVAWLMPALALGSASLALGSVMPVGRASAGLAGLWLVGASIGLSDTSWSNAQAFVDGFVAFRPAGQLLSLLIAVASAVLISTRRDAFETLR